MAFITKIDYSRGRQIKQDQNSTTILPGKTQFGMEYEDRLLGPDLSSITTDLEISNIVSTFSGNTTNIIFSWGSPYMEFVNDFIEPYDINNSGETRIIEEIFTGYNPYVYNSFTYYRHYSGVTFDLTISEIIDLGGGKYSGTTFTENLEILDAPSLDYVGDGTMLEVRGVSKLDSLETYSAVTFNNLNISETATVLYGKDPITSKLVEVPVSSVSTDKPVKFISGSTYNLTADDVNYWLEVDSTEIGGITIYIDAGLFVDIYPLIQGNHLGSGKIFFEPVGSTLLTCNVHKLLATIYEGAVFNIKIMSEFRAHIFGEIEDTP